MKVFRVWNNEIMQNLEGVIEGLLKYLGQNK
jgi:very-short-patch-repair endonuclease